MRSSSATACNLCRSPTKPAQSSTGFDSKVEAAIESGHVALLLHAKDASAEGTRKLAPALRRKFGATCPPQVDLFASDQLDLALGRANVVHAALKAEPASRAFLARCRRLAAYRGNGVVEDQGLDPRGRMND